LARNNVARKKRIFVIDILSTYNIIGFVGLIIPLHQLEATMTTIEIDFDVYKELTNRRKSEAVTYNDVLRELLKLPASFQTAAREFMTGNATGWTSKGVLFLNGTVFRASYKGRVYTAKVENNQLILDGKAMNSPSEASHIITGKSVNGWRFWECQMPGSDRWRTLDTFRSE
jgi:hypothetical protein